MVVVDYNPNLLSAPQTTRTGSLVNSRTASHGSLSYRGSSVGSRHSLGSRHSMGSRGSLGSNTAQDNGLPVSQGRDDGDSDSSTSL